MEDFYKINLGDSIVFWSFKLNEREIKKQFSLRKVYFPEQIHSNIILFVENNKKLFCDGLFTREKNVLVGVKTADCVPLIISHKSFLGAVHCGWRGLSSGILKNLTDFVQNGGAALRECLFFLGPSIGKCCYEVKEDVGSRFLEFFKDGKLDLKGFILDFLIKNGSRLENIRIDYTCTFCNKNLPSYRRERSKGRILTGIFRKN